MAGRSAGQGGRDEALNGLPWACPGPAPELLRGRQPARDLGNSGDSRSSGISYLLEAWSSRTSSSRPSSRPLVPPGVPFPLVLLSVFPPFSLREGVSRHREALPGGRCRLGDWLWLRAAGAEGNRRCSPRQGSPGDGRGDCQDLWCRRIIRPDREGDRARLEPKRQNHQRAAFAAFRVSPRRQGRASQARPDHRLTDRPGRKEGI